MPMGGRERGGENQGLSPLTINQQNSKSTYLDYYGEAWLSKAQIHKNGSMTALALSGPYYLFSNNCPPYDQLLVAQLTAPCKQDFS